MRAFAWFLGVLVAAGLAAASIAYPVFELTSRIAPWPFHRVYGRIALLAAVGALVFWCRRFGVANRRELGYGLPWRRFCAVAALFAAFGVVTASAGRRLLARHGNPRGFRPGVARLARAPCPSCTHRALLGCRGRPDRGDGHARRPAQRDRARIGTDGRSLAHRAPVRRAAFLCQDPRRLARLDERLSLAGRLVRPARELRRRARFAARLGP